ncbi:MAG: methionyl-tRNA formyltransferase [Christensenellaceae bacterium]|nr:methionyl-tRNA formyltransferase [Christensenellaceae bacterium]
MMKKISKVNKEDLSILFMGTPDFAVNSLKMLVEEGYTVKAVVTQPDRPKGRGKKLLPPPVKVYAEEQGIPVLQYNRVSREGLEEISELGCNLFITASFGQILSRKLLALPEHGTINVHGSLLPKYRGAAPIEWAIMNGEEKTGITTMYTVFEIDAGDMLLKKEVPIDPEMTGGELFERMAVAGAETLKETLEKLTSGELTSEPQNEEEMTYYPMFERGFGKIDFRKTFLEIKNLVRALQPDMAAYFEADGQKIQVYGVNKVNDEVNTEAGCVIAADPKKGLLVQAGDGVLEITELKYPGKNRMEAKAFLRGRKIEAEKL